MQRSRPPPDLPPSHGRSYGQPSPVAQRRPPSGSMQDSRHPTQPPRSHAPNLPAPNYPPPAPFDARAGPGFPPQQFQHGPPASGYPAGPSSGPPPFHGQPGPPSGPGLVGSPYGSGPYPPPAPYNSGPPLPGYYNGPQGPYAHPGAPPPHFDPRGPPLPFAGPSSDVRYGPPPLRDPAHAARPRDDDYRRDARDSRSHREDRDRRDDRSRRSPRSDDREYRERARDHDRDDARRSGLPDRPSISGYERPSSGKRPRLDDERDRSSDRARPLTPLPHDGRPRSPPRSRESERATRPTSNRDERSIPRASGLARSGSRSGAVGKFFPGDDEEESPARPPVKASLPPHPFLSPARTPPRRRHDDMDVDVDHRRHERERPYDNRSDHDRYERDGARYDDRSRPDPRGPPPTRPPHPSLPQPPSSFTRPPDASSEPFNATVLPTNGLPARPQPLSATIANGHAPDPGSLQSSRGLPGMAGLPARPQPAVGSQPSAGPTPVSPGFAALPQKPGTMPPPPVPMTGGSPSPSIEMTAPRALANGRAPSAALLAAAAALNAAKAAKDADAATKAAKASIDSPKPSLGKGKPSATSSAPSPSSAAPPKPSKPVVKTREVYERLSQVGEGTYGKVYKARHIETGRLVALKRIRMEAEKDGFPVTAVREIKLLQALRHPNVVPLIEMLVSHGHVYMVLEYHQHDLTGALRSQQITFTHANIKSLIAQLLRGLGYIHARGVLHRDLKGSNVLLSANGELKLADFGLARIYARNRAADYSNRVVTLWYRAIELLYGATMYGPSVDMWAAGCIFLELFTARPIFQGTDELDQLTAIYKLMGTPDLATWPAVAELPWYELVRPTETLPSHLRGPFASKYVPTPGALQLAAALLELNPARRPSCEEALLLPYFTEEAPSEQRPMLDNVDESHELTVKRARQSAGAVPHIAAKSASEIPPPGPTRQSSSSGRTGKMS